MVLARCLFLVGWLAAATIITADVRAQSDYKSLTGDGTETAGPFGNLDESGRYFAILKSVDAERGKVVLTVEGDQDREWGFAPGAELWCHGWWCRLDQFTVGDRVWVWFEHDKDHQPVRVSLMADEVSEQDLYEPYRITAIRSGEDASMTVTALRGNAPLERTVKIAGAVVYRGESKLTIANLQAGDNVYMQTTGENARLILDPAAFEQRREKQRHALQQMWLGDGLPATVIFSHPDRQAVEVMLDHEGLQWGRTWEAGDRVNLLPGDGKPAVVQKLRPWRERTQVLLQLDAATAFPDWQEGDRVSLRMSAAAELGEANVPVGLDKPRNKADRVEWIMSSIYCTCSMNDVCAGHVYTLAGCDAGPGHTCDLARSTRATIAEAIDQGQSDRQIFDALLKERGAKLLRPHMLP